MNTPEVDIDRLQQLASTDRNAREALIRQAIRGQMTDVINQFLTLIFEDLKIPDYQQKAILEAALPENKNSDLLIESLNRVLKGLDFYKSLGAPLQDLATKALLQSNNSKGATMMNTFLTINRYFEGRDNLRVRLQNLIEKSSQGSTPTLEIAGLRIFLVNLRRPKLKRIIKHKFIPQEGKRKVSLNAKVKTLKKT